MSEIKRTFSESWHRVAKLKISLLPTVAVRKQFFRGEDWYIIHNPFNNQFFRLRPEAYTFIARLSSKRSVEDVWYECLERYPDTAPGQEDVVQLLTQLYNANLLFFHSRPDTSQIFERYQQRKKKEMQSKLMSILFMRLPLFDPDMLLQRLYPIWKLIVSPVGAFIWLFVVMYAIKVCIDNSTEVFNQMQGILAPGNFVFLYIALVMIKTLHEIAHAIVCRRFGGEVHVLGIMLLVFTPLPYMDATSSWTFRNRWHRILVSAAGILMEIFIAALAVFIWANTGPGALHALCYNVMFIASVSTLLFNANPLLRFDGYYILSDILDIPNLHTRAKEYLTYLLERYAFGCKDIYCPVQTMNEAISLGVFGFLSQIYRILIFVGILLFVFDKFLILGMVMLLIGIVSWGLVPIYKFVVYLISSPKFQKNRVRVFTVMMITFSIILCLILFVPFTDSLQAPGIIEAKHFQKKYSDHPGYVSKVFKPAGSLVKTGEQLIQLYNKEIEFDLANAQSQKKETQIMIKQARNVKVVDLKPLLKRLEKVESHILDLKERMNSLTIRSSHDGIWQPADEIKFIGRWIPRGGYLGQVIDPSCYVFSAAVPQHEAARLFQDTLKKQSVRIKGIAWNEISVKSYQVIPFEQSKLPSMAIGWSGGGQIETSFQDNTGLTTREPFFLIIATLVSNDDILSPIFFHGRSGRINMVLPPKPLYYQFFRSIKQLFQKRYQI